jgi:BirA family biotin operon repressor/biotin-[acetyl-CoA-carboxylase] ligase
VAVLRALRTMGDFPLQLKWPNDLQSNGRKLGGILIELRAEAAGPAYVVVGIGLNVQLPAATQRKIALSGTQGVGLRELIAARVDRNALAAHVIAELSACLQEFTATGFQSFREEWSANDAFAGRPVQVHGNGSILAGIADGVDADGALRLRVGDNVLRIVSGDVSLRGVA